MASRAYGLGHEQTTTVTLDGLQQGKGMGYGNFSFGRTGLSSSSGREQNRTGRTIILAAGAAVGTGLAIVLGTMVLAQAPVTPPPSQPVGTPTASAATQAPPAVTHSAGIDIETRARMARELVQTFRERFKAALHASLKTNGLAASVADYQTFAADIITTLSEESQFEIGRTSTRLRNPDNAPDTWEIVGMEKFAAEIKAGADPMKLERFEVTKSREGQNLFRYMRPIVMRDSCLGCHGTEVKADVKSEISKLYSDDKALGYALGEMRGAFTLVQQLD
jgi:Protein of unknown function (DUF3365)